MQESFEGSDQTLMTDLSPERKSIRVPTGEKSEKEKDLTSTIFSEYESLDADLESRIHDLELPKFLDWTPVTVNINSTASSTPTEADKSV